MIQPANDSVLFERQDGIAWIGINRPAKRNAVDGPTARALAQAFRDFDADEQLKVAILYGKGEHFCAGADLEAVAGDDATRAHRLEPEGDGPMGPSRMELGKPVIAAVSGYCVAGGLELALWCDLRVCDESAVFGVFCRRFGVPLIDGGTVRLPRIVGMGHAMDMILTGRPVNAEEAKQMGLANRCVVIGSLMEEAQKLAGQIGAFPQLCLRNDRQSAYRQWSMTEKEALAEEFRLGMQTLHSGETRQGASRFVKGAGRHGDFKP